MLDIEEDTVPIKEQEEYSNDSFDSDIKLGAWFTLLWVAIVFIGLYLGAIHDI
jgi:hypothetical protein